MTPCSASRRARLTDLQPDLLATTRLHHHSRHVRLSRLSRLRLSLQSHRLHITIQPMRRCAMLISSAPRSRPHLHLPLRQQPLRFRRQLLREQPHHRGLFLHREPQLRREAPLLLALLQPTAQLLSALQRRFYSSRLLRRPLQELLRGQLRPLTKHVRPARSSLAHAEAAADHCN